MDPSPCSKKKTVKAQNWWSSMNCDPENHMVLGNLNKPIRLHTRSNSQSLSLNDLQSLSAVFLNPDFVSISSRLFLGVDGMSATACKVTPDPIHQWSKWVTLLASARRRIHWWQVVIHLQSMTTRAWFHIYEAAMQELAHILWVLVMGLLMDHLVLMQFFW